MRSPWPHRVAILTVLGTLLGVSVGALVTTKNAGMAFADWPTSDGENMFLYPWLESTGDKFLEHGHRLAGSLIGVLAIASAVTFWRADPRKWARWFAVSILLVVICQGLLGGARVTRDERVLAMIHSSSGAFTLSLMGVLVLIASRGWWRLPTEMITSVSGGHAAPKRFRLLGVLATLLPVLVIAQYLLGGVIRHLGSALWEHAGGSAVVAALTMIVASLGAGTGRRFLTRPAWLLFGFVFVQIGLGLAAYAMKFGMPALGIVSVQGSLQGEVFRTVHAVGGMILLLLSVRYAVRVWRWNHLALRMDDATHLPATPSVAATSEKLLSDPSARPSQPSPSPPVPVESSVS